MTFKTLGLILKHKHYIILLLLGMSYIFSQEIPVPVPHIDQNQLPKQPMNVNFNVLNKNSNLGFQGNSSCLCTFFFDERLKHCLLQLSDEEFNREVKSYHDNRIKHVWRMLDRNQKIQFLSTVDEVLYQRIIGMMEPLPEMPKTKREWLALAKEAEGKKRALEKCEKVINGIFYVAGLAVTAIIFGK